MDFIPRPPGTEVEESGSASCNASEKLAPTTMAMPSTMAMSSIKNAAAVNGLSIDLVRQFSRHRGIGTLLIYRDMHDNKQPALAEWVAARTISECQHLLDKFGVPATIATVAARQLPSRILTR